MQNSPGTLTGDSSRSLILCHMMAMEKAGLSTLDRATQTEEEGRRKGGLFDRAEKVSG